MGRAEAFVRAARTCVGARFRLQGRDPRFGLDCIGVVVWAAQAVGIRVCDQNDYSLSDDPARLTNALQAMGWRVKPTRACALGDIGVFESAGALRHLGVLTPDTLIHADIGLRRVVEHGLTPLWQERLHLCYRIF
jgi:cell wall-associated NlpC family hydrolase